MAQILGITVDFSFGVESAAVCSVQLDTTPPFIDTRQAFPDEPMWEDCSYPACSRRISQIITELQPAIANADMVVLKSDTVIRAGAETRLMPWLWGRIVDTTVEHNINLEVIAPSLLSKYVTGKAIASKSDVLNTAIKLWPDIHVAEGENQSAVYTAVILAAIGCRLSGSPIDDVPNMVPLSHIAPKT